MQTGKRIKRKQASKQTYYTLPAKNRTGDIDDSKIRGQPV